MAYYAIKWVNSLGKKVVYPEKVWKTKKAAMRFARVLRRVRERRSGTIMRNIKIFKIMN